MIIAAIIFWAIFVAAGIVVGVTLWRRAQEKKGR